MASAAASPPAPPATPAPRRRGGRPLLDGVRMVRGSVSLTPAQWARLRELGEGNASEGVRRLLAARADR